MCSNDPTSVVINNWGQTSCLVTQMHDCKFNMHDFQQMDFDVRIRDCGSTWSAPLWITPDFWADGGNSGEIDMVELCPAGEVNTNFAGADAPVGYPSKWGADPNWFAGHVTMWKQWTDGKGGITVKVCDHDEAAAHGGSCHGDGAAYYPDIYASNACNGHDCTFRLVSDIWNGVDGDWGFKGCSKGVPQTAHCRHSIRNIKIRGPAFSGKCKVLSTTSDMAV